MKAVFLDRDETLNHDPGYINDPEIIKLKDSAAEGLKLLSDAGYIFFILTNQSGVGRGKILPEQLDAVHKRLLEELEKHSIHIEKIYYCPHVDEDHCTCRKPKSGLLDQALSEYEIDIEKSFLIGDRIRDIIPGEKVRMKGILVFNKIAPSDKIPSNLIFMAENLIDAAGFILKSDS
ncbi:MAG: HAD family hydrolase [Spirochaetia bacterium]|nr:HAD family hydrolase [Spirochaetia bacterium]